MPKTPYGFSFDRINKQQTWNMSAVHSHPDHELYFLISGQRRYFLGHTIYDVAPGDFVFIPRTILHKTVSMGTKGFDRYTINFPPSHYETFSKIAGADLFRAYPNGACFQLPADKVRQVQKHFEQLEADLKGSEKWSRSACVTTLYKLLSDCIRYGIPKTPSQEDSADKIQRAAKYISEHYSQELTLEDAADLVHMEKTYFSKRFKALTGFGFLDYLTQTRLRAAEALLTDTDMTIGAVSDTCGFSGSNYFSDVFRRYHGISPSQYRLKSRQNTL